ncbi:hypothetical protein [Phenylobacterium sp.]|uniref:hypothetical protein n=1 Tax=Phenylobacterium sp. TaxID=1871053 RepID=UPI00286B6D34|nr:hypothetical protein [Phenylobacterium sp.]
MKTLLALSAALALGACTPTNVTSIPAPVELAGRTAVDEEARNGIELGYKAFRLALELGVDTGAIKGARATRARAANVAAYRSVGVMRQAYATANQADWLAAARSANIAVEQGIAAVRGQ